jgi:RHS repeat-associated protein
LAVYSPYGKQTITSGASVTPFGFQGSYTDSTGLIYLVNRYYDPSTDQFLSIDPEVATTDQPYVFANDDPLNAEDPLGTRPDPKSMAKEFQANSCQSDGKHCLTQLEANIALAIITIPIDFGPGEAIDGAAFSAEGADSVVNGVKLGRQLASEAQMSEAGTSIAGAGSDTELRAADQLAKLYGGSPEDYAKVSSSSYRGSDGFQFETHSYVNTSTGNVFEAKTVFPINSYLGYK